jgi:hypothetical protein
LIHMGILPHLNSCFFKFSARISYFNQKGLAHFSAKV